MPPAGTRSRIRVRLIARAIDEPHRVASQLELLFDLTFVVAIGAATAQLAHDIADGHAWAGVVPFLQIFFAIWWAWMNFTWFASSYDPDDVAHRLLTMVQMAGVLVLAAGVPAAAEHYDYRTVTLGYFVMRIALVAQWLRVAVADRRRRRTALRYAAGVAILQIGWVLRLVLDEAGALSPSTALLFFAGLAVLELAVPRWAERTGPTNWHPHHIAERYGLFTIILLGESVLATTRGVQGALAAAQTSTPLVVMALSGLVLLFAFWWLYFLAPTGEGLTNRRHRSYLWGYGHYCIFAALAALGAGLEVAAEQTAHQLEASPLAVCYAIAIPAAVFLVLFWMVHVPIVDEPVTHPAVVSGCTAVILLLPLATVWVGTEQTGLAAVVAGIAGVCVLLIAFTLTGRPGRKSLPRRPARHPRQEAAPTGAGEVL